ncbi:sugar kinase [Thermococcus litoralis DSM 5473]|uniref:Sugar kinase n=5 Tax=Thermococcaceae TaxID=2259 RepID=Q9HH01_PYRFU|nr:MULTISPECIES: carbohydrate kinase [Thermococcaceae]AAG45371.1 sugar kinase [Pyrococcus furiosus]AAG45387.1 sugar kinase [Thermococcus litoralis]AAL81862.1 sugar kinase [Pyrococcus furiosus DSM 3638]AFN04903.1 sugar kinase [Pyrococcus furiosus COM1]EHR78235.1 sugar kinase [Thermococcus litoralis DSM 5473]
MIYAIGEILIDFIAKEEGKLKDVREFEKHPGGAPANVVVGLRRLGAKSALISKVGDDPFGEFLIEELKKERVETKYIIKDTNKHTGIVFVQLIGAKPEFILYDGVAYFNLRKEEIQWDFMRDAELLHFGSVLFAREPSRSTVFEVLRAVKGKVPISYDVNIRLDLWRGREKEMLKDIEEALKLADIVKIGDGELEYLNKNGIALEDFNFALVAITRGAEGSTIIHKDIRVDVPSFKVEPVDTTGAGDAFMAALLASLFYMGKLDILEFSKEELKELGSFANLVAALSTTKRGAWSVPSLEEVLKHRKFSFLP